MDNLRVWMIVMVGGAINYAMIGGNILWLMG